MEVNKTIFSWLEQRYVIKVLVTNKSKACEITEECVMYTEKHHLV